jgi:hypothetical protein
MATPTTRKKKPVTERWRLYTTLTAEVIVNPAATMTPYADAYKKVCIALVDTLLCMNSYNTKTGIKLRTQENTVNNKLMQTIAQVKLFVYVKDRK